MDTTATKTRASTSTAQSSGMTQAVEISTEGISPSNIRAVLLADGYHNASDCSLVQFAIGEAHSPIYPSKVYPTLKFRDQSANGTWVYVPLSQIMGVSTQTVSEIPLSSTR